MRVVNFIHSEGHGQLSNVLGSQISRRRHCDLLTYSKVIYCINGKAKKKILAVPRGLQSIHGGIPSPAFAALSKSIKDFPYYFHCAVF